MSPYGPYRHWLCPSRGKEAADKNERPVASAGSVADIIDRLLAAVKADAPIQRALVVSAAAEIKRLRRAIRRLAEQDATLSVCNGNVTVTMDATLTDEEQDDLRVWLAECLRQASAATEGANEELAERWNERAKRAAAMLQRQY